MSTSKIATALLASACVSTFVPTDAIGAIDRLAAMPKGLPAPTDVTDPLNTAEWVTFGEAVRETTERERVIGELRKWALLGAGWDGEDALPPISRTLILAQRFVCDLDVDSPLPEPMLHASGEAGLFWNDEDRYAALKFLGDGRVAYFVKRGEALRTKGEVDGNTVALSAVLDPILFAPLAAK